MRHAELFGLGQGLAVAKADRRANQARVTAQTGLGVAPLTLFALVGAGALGLGLIRFTGAFGYHALAGEIGQAGVVVGFVVASADGRVDFTADFGARFAYRGCICSTAILPGGIGTIFVRRAGVSEASTAADGLSITSTLVVDRNPLPLGEAGIAIGAAVTTADGLVLLGAQLGDGLTAAALVGATTVVVLGEVTKAAFLAGPGTAGSTELARRLGFAFTLVVRAAVAVLLALVIAPAHADGGAATDVLAAHWVELGVHGLELGGRGSGIGYGVCAVESWLFSSGSAVAANKTKGGGKC